MFSNIVNQENNGMNMTTKNTKGIILAGGLGTRLFPITQVASKQLLPVYDKPMIYYPIASLMLGGIKNILIITCPEDTALFENLLQDGSRWGINISYAEQTKPNGIAEAFIIAKEFIKGSQSCLILGDNLFYGKLDYLRKGLSANEGCTIFAYQIDEPQRYGVVEFDEQGKVLSIEEKPDIPKSNFAIPGLYIFDENVAEIATNLKPSSRGELEITDLQIEYQKLGKLNAIEIGRGITWFDTGTPDSLVDAAEFIRMIEKRQGLKISCLEEIALNQGFISHGKFNEVVSNIPNSPYRNYLEKIVAINNC